MQFKGLLTILTALGLTLGLSSSLMAQHQEAMGEYHQAQESLEFTPEQKDAFVAAYAQVSGIQQEYQAQINSEMDQQEMQQLADQANQRIETAIDSQENMNTDTYRQILVALETDQELLNAIQTRLQGQGM